jgi:DnaJ-class molecular chaperone
MEFSLIFLVGMIVLVFVLFRGMGSGGRMRCNRCDGTGQVNEHWPDPNESSGWHHVEGICPKCKGKGKI